MFDMNWWIPAVIVGGMVGLMFVVKYGWVWLWARRNGVPVSVVTLMGMSLRKTPAHLIVENLIAAKGAGLDLSIVDLEGLYLAGGHVTNVVRALIASQKLKEPLDFKRAFAIDLSGRDVLDLVQSVAHPKVLQCKDPFTGGDVIEAQAGDGIPIRVKASMVVRPCLTRVIGGGKEEVTIEVATKRLIALIAERSSAEVLGRPSAIGEQLVAQDRESGTAFEIISVDIMARRG